MKVWNEHRVRKQKNRNITGGIPDELFKCPENFGAVDFQKEVNQEQLKGLYSFCKEPVLVNPAFKEVADALREGIPEPLCPEDAYNLYNHLLAAINNL